MVIVLKCGVTFVSGSFLHIIFIGKPQFKALGAVTPARFVNPGGVTDLDLIGNSRHELMNSHYDLKANNGNPIHFAAENTLTVRLWNQFEDQGWDWYTGAPINPRDLPI